MSDRNSNQSTSPRDAERYAELADLMGDFGVDTAVTPRNTSLESAFTDEESASLESALASVDANYPIRPREVPISSPAMARSWQAAPGSMARATPVASPLSPQVLDAWDLRPSYNPHAQTAEEAFFPNEGTAPAMATPDVWPDELAMTEVEVAPELLDEDAFQSVLDGLEGDILSDEELTEFAEPVEERAFAEDINVSQPAVPETYVAESVVPEPYATNAYTTQTFAPEPYQAQVVEVAAPIEPTAEFDPLSDFDAVFEDAFSGSLSPNPQTAADPVDFEPEFEELDIVSDQQSANISVTPALAAAAGGGLAALGSLRANASRETQLAPVELPAAVSLAPKTTANSEPMFIEAALPYDDVPVTGSLKVPEFVAAEEPRLTRSTEYDDFQVDDFPRTSAAVPPQNQPVVHAPTQYSKQSEDDLSEVDFADAFDGNFDPTDELADLVGSNIEPDPLFDTARNEDFAPMPAMPPMEAPKSSRSKWLAFGALGLALFGGLAIYGSTGDSADTGTEPALVRADVEPVRVAPDNPGGTVVPNQDRVVFNEVGNGNTVPEAPQEALIDGRQEPAIAAAPAKEDDRVLNGDLSAEPEAGNGTAIAPRAVQTVTVRPDGTLVVNEPAAPEASTPQAEIVPEARPEVAVAEQPQPLPAPTVAETAATTEAAPATEANVADTPPAADAALQEIAEAKVPVRVVETKPVTQKPKAEAQPVQPAEALEAVPSRPSDQPVNVVNAEAPAVREQPTDQQVAAVETAPAPAAGAYSIQIASTPSEESATATLRSLSGKFGSVLGGKDYTIQRAEVAGKGTVYRVRIAAGSKDDANKLCARYKSAGGSCFVTR